MQQSIEKKGLLMVMRVSVLLLICWTNRIIQVPVVECIPVGTATGIRADHRNEPLEGCPNQDESPDVERCRRSPSWKKQDETNFRETCETVFNYQTDAKALTAGENLQLSSVYDFNVTYETDIRKYWKGYATLDVMERPLVRKLVECIEQTVGNETSHETPMRKPSISNMHRRSSDGLVFMAVVDDVLNEEEARHVEALAKCMQEHADAAVEIRDFSSGGGNDCTYMAGFLQLLLPGVAAQLRSVLHTVWEEARWGEDPMEFVPIDISEAGRRYSKSHKVEIDKASSSGPNQQTSNFTTQWWPDPRKHATIRSTEYLTYDRWGDLGVHEDNGSDYTLVVSLAEPTDYEGGEFKIYGEKGNEETKVSVKPNRLSAVVFLSEFYHGVESITTPGRVTFANEFWRYKDAPTFQFRPDPKEMVFGDPEYLYDLSKYNKETYGDENYNDYEISQLDETIRSSRHRNHPSRLIDKRFHGN